MEEEVLVGLEYVCNDCGHRMIEPKEAYIEFDCSIKICSICNSYRLIREPAIILDKE